VLPNVTLGLPIPRAATSRAPLLRAYVDETGDRGTSAGSSSFFAFAAVLVADEDEAPMRAAVSQLRRDLTVPMGKPLHWKDHVKTFPRRQHVTRTLIAVPNLMVVYVLVEKSAIPASALMRRDQAVFYNFAAAMVLERALLAGQDWPGGPRQVVIRFGHVRGFNHQTTRDYFDLRIASNDPDWVPWHLLSGPAHFNDQAQWDGLQAADQFAGMLSAAIRKDAFGNYEPYHLLAARPLIRSHRGHVLRYGFKFLGNPTTLSNFPWWADADIR
jgi:hypothetical protein